MVFLVFTILIIKFSEVAEWFFVYDLAATIVSAIGRKKEYHSAQYYHVYYLQ